VKTAVRVLLVEHDRLLRKVCETTLAQRGFAVITATDGEEGLALARSDGPALVLLDLLMPKMPGIAVLEALKSDQATSSIPVVILSNSSREEDRRRAMELGAAGYYVKANLSLRMVAEEVEKLVTAG
jgi:DNA-binding response OmpR family regulator